VKGGGPGKQGENARWGERERKTGGKLGNWGERNSRGKENYFWGDNGEKRFGKANVKRRGLMGVCYWAWGRLPTERGWGGPRRVFLLKKGAAMGKGISKAKKKRGEWGGIYFWSTQPRNVGGKKA